MFQALDQAPSIYRVQSQRFLQKNMAPCLGRLLCQRQMRVRWCRNMNYVEPVLGKHAIEIRIPVRHRVAKCKLLGQDRLKVANRQHTRTPELLNLLDVTVSDFPAANNANIQHQFLPVAALARSMFPVCAAATVSRPCPMASIARYICHAETK